MRELIESAALKLTVSYLAVIMFISVGFSVVVFQTASHEVTRNTVSQGRFLNSLSLRLRLDDFAEYRNSQINESRHRLITQLVTFNVFVLVTGGLGSYWLALRTLRPVNDAMEAQNRFISDASHELRTPLTALQSEIEVTLMGAPSKNEAVNALKSGLDEVKHMRLLTDRLLSLNDTKTTAKEIGNTELYPVISKAAERMDKIARAKSIKLNLPPKPRQNMKIRGPLDRWVEVLTILLDNAIKFSPSKSTVTIKLKTTPKEAVVSVIDQGSGIAKKDMPYIFERFYQADKARQHTENRGYGLGLSIAKRLVEQYGGRLKIATTTATGTSIELRVSLYNVGASSQSTYK